MSKNIIIYCAFIGLIGIAYGQKQTPFTGHIIYHVELEDSIRKEKISLPDMRVFTNDTLSRIEVMSNSFGPQITIKHLELNKSYLLLEYNQERYAIQTNRDSLSQSDLKYTYQKLRKCSKRIDGYKTDVYRVTSLKDNNSFEVTVFKGIRSDILDVFPGIPALPAIYTLSTPDGPLFYQAHLVSEETPTKDHFGVPSDFKKVTMGGFLNQIAPTEN